MGGRKITITVPEEIYEQFVVQAKENGFLGVPAFVRHEALKAIRHTGILGTLQTVLVPVDNYEELQGYVGQKKFGSIASFATFAMESVMQRNPLTEAQKARAEKVSGKSGYCV